MGQIVEDIAGLGDKEHKIRRKHKRRCQRRRKSIKQKNKGNRGEEQRRKRGNWQTGCAAGEREDLSTNCILRSSYDISRRFHLLSSFTASEGDSGSSFR